MLRKSWLLIVVAAVGCGTAPTGDSATPAASTTAAMTPDGATAPAVSSPKPAADATAPDDTEETDVTVTQVAFNANGAPVVEFKAPGMHCEFCAATIVGVLQDKPGVVDVMADAETKVVTVAIKEGDFESETIVAAIADAGFANAPEESADSSNAG